MAQARLSGRLQARAHERIRSRLADERGRWPLRDAPVRVALCYPSPYAVGMSSLGFQVMHRLLDAWPKLSCRRAFLPEDDLLPPPGEGVGPGLITYEDQRSAGDADALLFSVAYDLEVSGLVRCLELAGLPLRRADRGPKDPVVIAGGPLSFSNPLPLVPLVDAIVMGEGEAVIDTLGAALQLAPNREAVREALRAHPSILVCDDDTGTQLPPMAQCDDSLLPAASAILTPHTALADMALVEAARGCSRGCTFCVMGRWTNGGMRLAPPERILAKIPDHARRVGLVGAAVSDHPKIIDVMERLVASGREIGLSSLRADRLNNRFVSLLAAGGYRTMTVAADAPSETLRYRIEKRIKEQHLIRAAQLAKDHGLAKLKTYSIIGLPGERDEDMDELARLCGELALISPLALTVSVFVPKNNTPMATAPFCGVKTAKARIQRLRRALARLPRREGKRGRHAVELRAMSAREGELEFRISQGGPAVGEAAIEAHRLGGGFSAWRQALQATPGCEPLWSRDDTPDSRWAYQPGGRRELQPST